MGSLLKGLPIEQGFCQVDDVGVEAVGGDGDAIDDVLAFVHLDLEVNAAPWKLLFLGGVEMLPFPVEVVVGGDSPHGFLDFFQVRKIFKVNGFGFHSIDFLEGFDQRLDDVFGGDVGQFREVYHAAGHRLHAMFLQFRLVDGEIALHHLAIGLDEDGAMVQVVLGAVEKGVARELPVLAEEVVAARDGGFQPETLQRLLDDGLLLSHVVVVLVGNKGKVEVAEVVIDGPASGTPSHEVSSFVVELFHVAFSKGILVEADDHGPFVLPEIHGHGPLLLMLSEPGLHGEVQVRVMLLTDNDLKFSHDGKFEFAKI